MNALKILQDQHREVEALFKAFEKANSEDLKKQLFMDIADALAAHSEIEEKIFYPAIEEDKTEELLRESLEEHLSVKRLVADLLDLSPSDEQFEAKVLTLKEQVEHHVEEEEGDLFPTVKKDFGDEELDQLGVEMENLMADLMAEGEPSAKIPAQTDSAPPLS